MNSENPKEIVKKKKRKKTIGDYIRFIIMLIAIGVFLYSATKLVLIFLEYKQGTDEYKELTEFIAPDLDVAEDTKEETDSEEEELTVSPVDFKGLSEINPDIIGWIRLEAIDAINYPIVQREDNDYYLQYTFQGTKNGAGSVFVDYTNKNDFSDENTFVYGHNMKNGSMFGSLKSFHKKETFEISRYIWIYTPKATFKYEIFSYHVASVRSESFQNQYQSKEDFEEYVELVKRASEYDTGVEVKKEDKMITLSTCTNDSTTRFLVHAKLIETTNHAVK